VTMIAAAVAACHSFAFADATPVATLYKTGTDTSTKSRAASPGTPGSANGKAGLTRAGHTIEWVVSYQNNTGSSAGVDVTDPLTAAGAYVPDSLELPPGMH